MWLLGFGKGEDHANDAQDMKEADSSSDEQVDVELSFGKSMRLLANAKAKTAVKSKAAPKTPTSSVPSPARLVPAAEPVMNRSTPGPTAPSHSTLLAAKEESIEATKRGRGPRMTKDLTADANLEATTLANGLTELQALLLPPRSFRSHIILQHDNWSSEGGVD